MAEANKKEDEKGGEAQAAPAPASSSGKKKILLIGGGVVLLLVLIGVPVAFFALKSPPPESEQLPADAASHDGHEAALVMEGSHDEEELEEGEEPLGAFFPMETFVVNLSGRNYVRVQLQLEFNGREVPKRFYARLVPVRDAIISTLASRSPEDLIEEKGKEALKKDLRDRVNEILRKEEVKQIYFTQFFIQ